MPFTKITTKSLALSSVTSDTILNNTIKYDDLSSDVSSAIQNTRTIVQSNSASWGTGGGSGAGIISKTYAELKALKDTNQLVSGQYYKITDFKTAWWDYTTNNSQEIISNVIEPLIVLAVTENKFGTVAYSTLYPEDIIYYDFNRTYGFGKLGFGLWPTPNSKGWITRRIGSSSLGSIDTAYDWRSVTWSCRRCDLSSITPWTSSGTYTIGQVVKHYDKLFISLRDSQQGRIIVNDWRTNNQNFTIDNAPDISRAIFDSNRTYNIGDEVAYIAYPAIDPTNATILNGAIKYYRKTGSGVVGTLPTNTSTWTEASLLSDFDYSDRIAGFPWWFWKNENFFANPFYWSPVTSFTEGKTYFPTNEYGNDRQDAFYFVVPSKLWTRLPNDETPWSAWGSNNGSGTPKYSQFYGLPRFGWNKNLDGPSTVYTIPWDLSSKAQKPTFTGTTPTTTDSTLSIGNFGRIVLGESSVGNVFYYGCEDIYLNKNSHFNIFQGGNSGSQILSIIATNGGFRSNKIGQGVMANVFNGAAYGNSFGTGCSNNTTDDQFDQNILSLNCDNNTFGNECKRNIFGASCQNNNIGTQFIQNFCVGWFNNNLFGNVVIGNTFYFYSTLNQSEGNFFNNVVTAAGCRFGKEFNNNTGTLYSSTINTANNCKLGDFNNNIAASLLNCELKQTGVSNLNNVAYLTAGNAFYYNNVSFCNTLIVGNNFILNTIEPYTYWDYNFPNFLTASRVYNSYHKRIFKNENQIPKLSYIDANGIQQVVSPTA